MAEPTTSLPEWASTPNFPASIYPATLPWGDPHPQAGAATPWSNQPTRDAAGLAGVASAGHIPAKPTLSPQFNEWLHIAWEWIDWLEDNSDNPGNESRVLKTSADGKLTLVELEVGGSSTAASSVVLSQPTSNGPCLNISHTGVNFGMVVTTAGVALPGARFLSTGIAAALEAINLGGNGPAIIATGDNDKPGVDGFGDLTGPGLQGLGGSSNGPGVKGTSQSNAPGVRGDGAALAASYGGQFFAQHVDASGVYGTTLAGAGVLAAGVVGIGLGDGNGGRMAAADGYCLLLAPGGTTRGALRMAPVAATPGTAADGDVSMVTESAFVQAKAHVEGTWQYLWHGRRRRGEDTYDDTIATSAVGTGGASFIINARPQFSTRGTGDVITTHRISLSKVLTDGSVTYTLESEDAGGGNNQVHETGTISLRATTNATTEASHWLTIQKKITPPSNANREYFVRITNPSANQVYVHHASGRVQGQFL